jgi:predicted nucleic acid-binding protein
MQLITQRRSEKTGNNALNAPDIINAATAIVSQATGLSNDKTFRKVPELEVFILDDAIATKRPGTT